jgi:hypothetical protein
VKKSYKTSFDWSGVFLVPTGCLIGLLQLSFIIVYILGVFHAFCQSAVLGIVSMIFPPVTITIEFIDWFSTKQLWWEITQILGL